MSFLGNHPLFFFLKTWSVTGLELTELVGYRLCLPSFVATLADVSSGNQMHVFVFASTLPTEISA